MVQSSREEGVSISPAIEKIVFGCQDPIERL